MIEKIGNYLVQTNKFLGEGSFGKVFVCKKNSEEDQELYCMKIISKEIKDKCNAKMQYQNEINILREIMTKTDTCENIIEVFDVFEDWNFVYIVTELCNMSLQSEFALNKEQGRWYTEQEQINIMKQIVNGSKFLAKNNLIHRDIKPDNILVKIHQLGEDSIKIYKIADFGFCRKLEDLYKRQDLTRIGTPLYCSPQLRLQEKFSSKSDIYSYGLMFYQIVYKAKLPDFMVSFKNSLILLRNKPFQCPQLQHQFGHEIAQLLEGMIVYSEEKRMSFEEIFKSSLFSRSVYEDSIFVKLIKSDEETIQKLQQIQQKTNFKSKFTRINKILEIFYRKFLLCKSVLQQFEQNQKLNSQESEMTKLYILIIGKQQLQFAIGLIRGCVSDIHPAYLEDNDVPRLLDILAQFTQESKENFTYQRNIEMIQQEYSNWNNIIQLKVGYLNSLFQNMREQQQVPSYSLLLKQLCSSKVDIQIVCNKLEEILKIQNYRKLNEELKDQTQKVIEIEQRFKVTDYFLIELDSIFPVDVPSSY